MPILTLYPAEHAILARQNTAAARWVEWSFEPVSEHFGLGRTGMRVCRWPMAPVAVRVPPGAKVEDVPVACDRCRECRDGRTVRRVAGYDAETVHYLAERGEKGFRIEEGEMAKRKQEGPMLFGDEHAIREVGDAPPDDFIPFAHSGAAIDRSERLEAAIREALPWLDDEDGRTPRPLTARNILETALGAMA